MSALPKVIKRGHLAVLRAIFTVRLLDDGNNRYQADGGWHRRGERGIAGVMIMLVMMMMMMMMMVWHKV